MHGAGERFEVHVAGIPDRGGQVCVRCGMMLLRPGDRDPFRTGDQIGVRVGPAGGSVGRRIIGARPLRPEEQECVRPVDQFVTAPALFSESVWNVATSTVTDTAPDVTLESLEQIMRQFTDRRPAAVVAVKIHPDYTAAFFARLGVEGFETLPGTAFVAGVEIIQDPSVPYGKIEYVYAGDDRR